MNLSKSRLKELEIEAVAEAAKSKCNERKVGFVIANSHGSIVGRGFNSHASCACQQNNTSTMCPKGVIHAEVAALADIATKYKAKSGTSKSVFHVVGTQPPCNECYTALGNRLGKFTLTVTQEFLKFDSDKDAYDLIPPEWEEALAKVLTHGAKKYKPNNWQQGNTDRYYAALKRHMVAWRKGERLDPDSGMPHLWHIFTNVGFLITLDLGEDSNEQN